MQIHTNSSSTDTTGNDIVLQLQIFIKDGRVELNLAIELASQLLPLRRRIRSHIDVIISMQQSTQIINVNISAPEKLAMLSPNSNQST